ncbi:MAG: hypothetical protein J3Q66DRAFT_415030 [Benniella sp.]|nr:MAG: hypothetical protein J3Q66DRAFT_407865 [Benniella sp.]KAK3811341.1 MAG: hypothetical protein J3Q66DRAFT_415030 [Benniella sp.]
MSNIPDDMDDNKFLYGSSALVITRPLHGIRIANTGPILDFDIGQRASNESHAGFPPQHELVATTGPVQNGALVVFQRSIRPNVVRSTEALAGSTSLWTMYCCKEIVFEGVSQYESRQAPTAGEDDNYDKMLIVSRETKTLISIEVPSNELIAIKLQDRAEDIAVYKIYQHFTTNKVDSAGNPIDLSNRLAICTEDYATGTQETAGAKGPGPFTDVSGYEGVFVLGASPFRIMANRRDMLRVHPMICDSRIESFTQFHTFNCKPGVITLNAMEA